MLDAWPNSKMPNGSHEVSGNCGHEVGLLLALGELFRQVESL